MDEKAAESEELMEKLERQNGRKEELKQLLEEKEVELDDIKNAYRWYIQVAIIYDYDCATLIWSYSMFREYLLAIKTHRNVEKWKRGKIKAWKTFFSALLGVIYTHCKYVHFIFSALKMKWQGKEETLSHLEVQVKRMKENFDIKEKKLTEERDKSLQTQRWAP